MATPAHKVQDEPDDDDENGNCFVADMGAGFFNGLKEDRELESKLGTEKFNALVEAEHRENVQYLLERMNFDSDDIRARIKERLLQKKQEIE